MRGASHVGVLRAIQEVQGSLEFPDGIYGFSVGAIFAVAVAFNVPFDIFERVMKEHHKRSWWLPALSISHAFGLYERKGVFPMDRFREMIISIYTACGIENIETKRICDAPQPLFIVASNLTTRRPAILTGEVPILDALCCSACIPFLFEPQVLYGDVYVDAAVYTRHPEHIVPPGTLVIRLFEYDGKVTPKSTLSDIFSACYYGKQGVPREHNICFLRDLKVGVITDVTDEEREELIRQGYLQTLAFLTKMAAKEGK
jgi:hypothetical protein